MRRPSKCASTTTPSPWAITLSSARGTRWSSGHPGPRTTRPITYVLAGGSFGIAPDYCVLGIKPLHSTSGTARMA
ncbi:MAG: DUF3850 domain-containing protein [Flavobacteriales bacterium]|nr:DUF3850 domain-containing protein [Flavobacteriales bacterium]